MKEATRWAAIAASAALALGCSHSATPRQTTVEQVDQAAGYTTEESDTSNRMNEADQDYDDMGDFDDTDYRDEGLTGDEDSVDDDSGGRGD